MKKTGLGAIVFNAFNLQIAEVGSGDEKLLENITFRANSTCTCTGATSLILGEGIIVESGASVTLRPPGV